MPEPNFHVGSTTHLLSLIGCFVLIVGFGGTLLSELPSLRLFGEVVIILLATALLANLLVLPALIAFVEGRREQASDAQPTLKSS